MQGIAAESQDQTDIKTLSLKVEKEKELAT